MRNTVGCGAVIDAGPVRVDSARTARAPFCIVGSVERATGARLGKTCGINGDDDDGDDDATLVRARPGGK